MKKVILFILACLIIFLIMPDIAFFSDVETEEEVIANAGYYCKCQLVNVEHKDDCPGKTEWTVYTFRDISLKFTFTYVVYKSYITLFGHNVGPGRAHSACNWEQMRDIYFGKNPLENVDGSETPKPQSTKNFDGSPKPTSVPSSPYLK